MAKIDAGDGLKKLEYLSLVSKNCTELESHVGCSDKVLAEFITELGRKSETMEEFNVKLKENGAGMPDYFVGIGIPTPYDEEEEDMRNSATNPMPETGERHLAQELRSVGLSTYDMPEWKKGACGKALTFGQRSKWSIQDQMAEPSDFQAEERVGPSYA